MKILKALTDRVLRLIVSVCHQIPFVLAGVALSFYAHHTFPDKIQSAFGITEAQTHFEQLAQATTLMKNMIGVSNPIASINYLTSLVSQTMAWSKLNTSQMFATAGTALCLWLIDAFLFLGVIYLIWRTYKTYRQKGRQQENAHLILKELMPYFKELQNEMQNLKQEISALKEQNGKSDFTDSPDTRG